MSFLPNLAADIIGAVDTVTPGRLGQTLNTNLRSDFVNWQGNANPGKVTAINGPSQPTAAVTNTGGTATGSWTGGGTGSTNLNQSYIDIINSALARLPGQLNTAKQNNQNAYNQNANELQSGFNKAQQSYDQSTGQNQQDYVNNKNTINSQASSGLRSLLRVLGAHGAGGGSAAEFAAPDAVGQVAQQQRAGAAQTFGQNQQNLDTNWNTFKADNENAKRKLNDWLTSANQQADATSESTRQSLLQQLLGLQPSVAAAQPYVDQINQSAARVDALGATNPTYTGVTPTYTAPSVASYTVNAPGAPVLGGGGNNTGAGESALAYILGLRPDQKQQLA